jgi:hypothetical protein
VFDGIIPIHKILSIHNGMDPNDSNLKFVVVGGGRYINFAHAVPLLTQ